MGYEMGALPNAITNNEQRMVNGGYRMIDTLYFILPTPFFSAT